MGSHTRRTGPARDGGRAGQPGGADVDRLISQNGVYEAQALERRDAIFDQLDARVALLNRDLPEEVSARPPPRFSPGLRAPMAIHMARRG